MNVLNPQTTEAAPQFELGYEISIRKFDAEFHAEEEEGCGVAHHLPPQRLSCAFGQAHPQAASVPASTLQQGTSGPTPVP